MPMPVLPEPGIREHHGEALLRCWLSRSGNLILTDSLWGDAPVSYVLDLLKDNGIHLRWHDTVEDRGCHNHIRDVYITSSILEKLYV
jgi:hypothetical protein